MRNATRIAALALGTVAGLAGLEHGYYEILQGSTPPAGLVFPSMGPPCDPQWVWNACEPAMSIVPNYLISGILSVLLGLAILVWSAGFLQRRGAGWVLMGLSLLLLLLGGGFFPPLIGLVGGAAATQIRRAPAARSGGWRRLAGGLWPWPLVIFVVWVLAQFPVGHYFNDFLKSIMGVGMLVILITLPLSVVTAFGRDSLRDEAGF